MLTITEADRFAARLTKLCQRYRVMLWTPLKTNPIMLSPVDENTDFWYVARPDSPASFTLNHILGDNSESPFMDLESEGS